MHLVIECTPLQNLRDDMPTLSQDIHSMRRFMWQENVVMSRFVHDAMSMMRAASSGDELGSNQPSWL